MQVRIYKPTKNPEQSGEALTQWVLEYIAGNNSKFLEPVMGRTSSRDPTNRARLKFCNLEDAVKFAKSQNYQIELIEPQTRKLIKKNYARNFQ